MSGYMNTHRKGHVCLASFPLLLLWGNPIAETLSNSRANPNPEADVHEYIGQNTRARLHSTSTYGYIRKDFKDVDFLVKNTKLVVNVTLKLIH